MLLRESCKAAAGAGPGQPELSVVETDALVSHSLRRLDAHIRSLPGAVTP